MTDNTAYALAIAFGLVGLAFSLAGFYNWQWVPALLSGFCLGYSEAISRCRTGKE